MRQHRDITLVQKLLGCYLKVRIGSSVLQEAYVSITETSIMFRFKGYYRDF